MMKTLRELLKQITQVTHTIETNYPELYRFLDETPTTTTTLSHGDLSKEVFEDYLDSLKQVLKKYIAAHKLRK